MKAFLYYFPPRAVFVFALVFALFACDDDDDDDDNDNTVKFENITLSGLNEVPIVESAGSGTFNGIYDKSTKVLSYTVSWSLGVDKNITAMHFHGPATVTESAGVVIGITGFAMNPSGSLASATSPLTTDQEAQLLDGKWYINIHSTQYPGGDIRGNLLP